MPSIVNPYLKTQKAPAASRNGSGNVRGRTNNLHASKAIKPRQIPPSQVVQSSGKASATSPTSTSKRSRPSFSTPTGNMKPGNKANSATPETGAAVQKPAQITPLKSNTNLKPRQISSQDKKPVTKNRKKSLKAHLKREIAMLKRQKAEKILAKKRAKEAAIQEQKRREREALRLKLLQEKKQRQEERFKNRERKIQEKKEKLQRDLEARRLAVVGEEKKKQEQRNDDSKVQAAVQKTCVPQTASAPNSLTASVPLTIVANHAVTVKSEVTSPVTQLQRNYMGIVSRPDAQHVINGISTHRQGHEQVYGQSVKPFYPAPPFPSPYAKKIMRPSMPYSNHFQMQYQHQHLPASWCSRPFPNHLYHASYPQYSYAHTQNYNRNVYATAAMLNYDTAYGSSIPKPRQRQPKKLLPQEMILHNKPLEPPSPFAKTHSLLPFKIKIYKKLGESFGVDLRYVTKGALVEIANPDPVSDPSQSDCNHAIIKPEVRNTTLYNSNIIDEMGNCEVKSEDNLKQIPAPKQLGEVTSETIGKADLTSISEAQVRKDAKEKAEAPTPMQTISSPYPRSAVTNDRGVVVHTKSPFKAVECLNEVKMEGSSRKEDMGLNEKQIAVEDNRSSNDILSSRDEFLLSSPPQSVTGAVSITTCGEENSSKIKRKGEGEANEPKLNFKGVTVARIENKSTPIHSQSQSPPKSLGTVNVAAQIGVEEKSCTTDFKVNALNENIDHASEIKLQNSTASHIRSAELHRSTDKKLTTMESFASSNPERPSIAVVAAANTSGTFNAAGRATIASTTTLSSSSLAPVTLPETVASKPATTKPSKPKRRRVQFGAMTVTSASQQNSRAKPGTPQDKLLQSGDIVLEIEGDSLAGLAFHAATKLFGKCKEKQNEMSLDDDSNAPSDSIQDAVIECTLLIARENKVTKILDKLSVLSNLPAPSAVKSHKPGDSMQANVSKDIGALARNTTPTSTAPTISVPVEPIKVAFVANETTGQVLAGEFSGDELKALVTAISEEDGDLNESTFLKILENPLHRSKLIQRSESDLRRKWKLETRGIDQKLSRDAVECWKKEWKAEVANSNEKDMSAEFVSPSQRSTMRNAARPLKGCKCGGLDHQYVNDSKCFLYRNLKSSSKFAQVVEKFGNSSLLTQNLAKYDGKLNSIGNAHMQRMVKHKDAEKAEVTEAKFVDEMEKIQVKDFKTAIFAPRLLSVMLLSSIASFSEKTNTTTGRRDYANEDSGDEEDEDIPLMTLGKRRSSFVSLQDRIKKRRVQRSVRDLNSQFMAAILSHISKTWGHLFWEPSQSETAWVEHCRNYGISSDFSPDSIKNSSKRPQILTYELIHHHLDSAVCKIDKTCCKDDLLMTYLCSNTKTGLTSEIKSLINDDIVEVDENGIARLLPNWEERVPPFILYDMLQEGWGKEIDRDNKFCLHDDIRNKLYKAWKYMPDGWVTRNDN